MGAKEKIKRYGLRNPITATEAAIVGECSVKHAQRTIKSLLDDHTFSVIRVLPEGRLVCGKPVPRQNAHHEHEITKLELGWKPNVWKRLDETDPNFLFDAEVNQEWGIEMDCGTMTTKKMKTRIEKIKDAPLKVLWVCTQASRIWLLGNMMEPLGENVFYTTTDWFLKRWVDFTGAPTSVRLKPN